MFGLTHQYPVHLNSRNHSEIISLRSTPQPKEKAIWETSQKSFAKQAVERANSLWKRKKTIEVLKEKEQIKSPLAKHQAETPIPNRLQLKDLPYEMVMLILKSLSGNFEALDNFGLTSKEYHAIERALATWKQKKYLFDKEEYEEWLVENFLINPGRHIDPKYGKLALHFEYDDEIKKNYFMLY